MYRTIPFTIFSVLVAILGAAPTHASSGVTLADALKKAMHNNPQLAAAAATIEATKGVQVQAGLPPNPELEVEMEDLGAAGGFDSVGTTVAISQDIELGGKRDKRREAARLETGLALADAFTLRLDLEAEVRTAFFEALAAQEKAKLQEELVGLAAKTLETVGERVKAGKVSPIEETQAQLEMAATNIELRKAWAEWGTARTALAGTWGETGEDLSGLDGSLNELQEIPPHEDLAALLSKSPDLERWSAELALSEATRELEAAGGVPDLGVTGGVTTVGGGDETTFLVAVSVPLMLFDRNQGAVAEASSAVARTRAERRSVERQRRGELMAAYQEIVVAREEAEALRDTILPGARQAYEAIREGYQWGKFEYLALLDAQRTLLEARGQLIDANEAFHLAKVRLDRLVAQTPNNITNP